MRYYLFLDDERKPEQVTWVNIPRDRIYVVVRSYQEFCDNIVSFGVPDFISFDHDLADQHYGHGLNNDHIPYDSYSEKTGYDCAKWLVDFCIDRSISFPEYAVHSMNPIGSENIKAYITSAKQHANI